MPDRRQHVVINVGGGWAEDFGPSFTGAPQGNALTLPFLLQADNAFYELDGAPHKIGGTSKSNSTAITESSSAVSVHGFIDYWKQGTAGSETQKLFAYAGTKLLNASVGGDWTSLTTGLENSRQPCFEIFGDKVFWASTSLIDVPQTWNQSAASTSNVSGSPPQFSFMVKHKNRMFAAGVASNMSRLYYSAYLNAEDWTGAGSGAIDIDPDDGDRITGLRSHKGELVVFKGPNRLSIHRITGSSPEDFARIPFVVGVGGINHNTIFAIGDDIAFSDPRGLHSLAATQNFGDYIEAFLSRPILSYYQDSLNHSVLNTGWGVNYQARGMAVWLFAKSGGTAKNVYLVYDYRFQPGRWASWGKDNAYHNANCLAIAQTSARKHALYAGGTDGFVRQLDVSDRSIDGTTAYTFGYQSPFINLGSSATMKNLEMAFPSFRPQGSYTFTLSTQRDGNAAETYAVSQGGGDTLG